MERIYVHDRSDDKWFVLKHPEQFESIQTKTVDPDPMMTFKRQFSAGLLFVMSLGGFIGGIYQATTFSENDRSNQLITANNTAVAFASALTTITLMFGLYFEARTRGAAKNGLRYGIQTLAYDSKCNRTFDQYFQQIYPPRNRDGLRLEIDSTKDPAEGTPGEPLLAIESEANWV